MGETKDPYVETQGTWFAAYGSVYSQLGDGSVVRVALMDREEPGTFPTERDANAWRIARMQNLSVGRMITDENRAEVLERLEDSLNA